MAAAGPSSPGKPHVGNEPARPVTAYGRSKLAAEEVVTASALPWTIIRPPTVYGPRDQEVLKVFRIARWGVAPVFGDGSQELSAVHGGGSGGLADRRRYRRRDDRQDLLPLPPEVVTSAGTRPRDRRRHGAAGRTSSAFRRPVGRALLALTETGARCTGQATILTADKANEFFQSAWTGDPTPLLA